MTEKAIETGAPDAFAPQPVKFDCNGSGSPAYTCSAPGDQSGEYYRAETYNIERRRRESLETVISQASERQINQAQVNAAQRAEIAAWRAAVKMSQDCKPLGIVTAFISHPAHGEGLLVKPLPRKHDAFAMNGALVYTTPRATPVPAYTAEEWEAALNGHAALPDMRPGEKVAEYLARSVFIRGGK